MTLCHTEPIFMIFDHFFRHEGLSSISTLCISTFTAVQEHTGPVCTDDVPVTGSMSSIDDGNNTWASTLLAASG